MVDLVSAHVGSVEPHCYDKQGDGDGRSVRHSTQQNERHSRNVQSCKTTRLACGLVCCARKLTYAVGDLPPSSYRYPLPIDDEVGKRAEEETQHPHNEVRQCG